jgi:NAD-dependent dihydropyrimidine dehydrogenase PreA subunit
MIELVSADRCVECQICIKVCPTFVFDPGDDGIPVIARQEDCQTCFMCEAYCPADALYVAHHADEYVEVDEEAVIQSGQLGSWRAAIGWGASDGMSMAEYDTTPMLRSMRAQR